MPSAEALARGYDLCSELFSFPMTPEMESIARSVEPFSDLIPPPEQSEEWAVRHQHVFGFEIFPYAGVFRDAESMLGGETARVCEDFYIRSGFESPSGGSESDHISVQLDFLAFLLRKEQRVNSPLLSEFLFEQVVRWMPPFLTAIHNEQDPLYVKLAETVWDLLVEHASLLEYDVREESRISSDQLDEGKKGDSVGNLLMNPSKSGWYVSRSTISKWGRKLNLPRGFGTRNQMLKALLDSATRYDETEAIFVDLSDSLASWDHAYETMAEDSSESIRAILSQWQEKIRRSREKLKEWYYAVNDPEGLSHD